MADPIVRVRADLLEDSLPDNIKPLVRQTADNVNNAINAALKDWRENLVAQIGKFDAEQYAEAFETHTTKVIEEMNSATNELDALRDAVKAAGDEAEKLKVPQDSKLMEAIQTLDEKSKALDKTINDARNKVKNFGDTTGRFAASSIKTAFKALAL